MKFRHARYSGTFAKSKDLGCTDTVKHTIIGQAHPIKQAPRTVPTAWREAQKEVEKMLHQGVIQPPVLGHHQLSKFARIDWAELDVP